MGVMSHLFEQIRGKLAEIFSQGQNESKICQALLTKLDSIAAATTKSLKRRGVRHACDRKSLNGLLDTVGAVAYIAQCEGKSPESAAGEFIRQELTQRECSLDSLVEEKGFEPVAAEQNSSAATETFLTELKAFQPRVQPTKRALAFSRWANEFRATGIRPNLSAISREAGIPRSTLQGYVVSFLSILRQRV